LTMTMIRPRHPETTKTKAMEEMDCPCHALEDSMTMVTTMMPQSNSWLNVMTRPE